MTTSLTTSSSMTMHWRYLTKKSRNIHSALRSHPSPTHHQHHQHHRPNARRLRRDGYLRLLFEEQKRWMIWMTCQKSLSRVMERTAYTRDTLLLNQREQTPRAPIIWQIIRRWCSRTEVCIGNIWYELRPPHLCPISNRAILQRTLQIVPNHCRCLR